MAKMLKEENKIFKNLYNSLGWEIDKAVKREDWSNTKETKWQGIFIMVTSICCERIKINKKKNA